MPKHHQPLGISPIAAAQAAGYGASFQLAGCRVTARATAVPQAIARFRLACALVSRANTCGLPSSVRCKVVRSALYCHAVIAANMASG